MEHMQIVLAVVVLFVLCYTAMSAFITGYVMRPRIEKFAAVITRPRTVEIVFVQKTPKQNRLDKVVDQLGLEEEDKQDLIRLIEDTRKRDAK